MPTEVLSPTRATHATAHFDLESLFEDDKIIITNMIVQYLGPESDLTDLAVDVVFDGTTFTHTLSGGQSSYLFTETVLPDFVHIPIYENSMVLVKDIGTKIQVWYGWADEDDEISYNPNQIRLAVSYRHLTTHDLAVEEMNMEYLRQKNLAPSSYPLFYQPECARIDYFNVCYLFSSGKLASLSDELVDNIIITQDGIQLPLWLIGQKEVFGQTWYIYTYGILNLSKIRCEMKTILPTTYNLSFAVSTADHTLNVALPVYV